MQPLKLTRVVGTLILLLAFHNLIGAQQAGPRIDHTRYKLVDLGTLGGPVSYESDNGEGNLVLNNSGVIAFSADIPASDPNAPFCANPDCFLAHAVRWTNGVRADLGALSGNNSRASAINARGWITGISTIDAIDPLTGLAEGHAVLWKDKEIMDLGTLGGNFSVGIYVKNSGQVVGMSTTSSEPDPFSFLGAPTRTFIWQDGQMSDLGTLGGQDTFSSAGCLNQNEELVVGASQTDSIVNPSTGSPTVHPFLWKNGEMQDLGTLGGTLAGVQCANNRGQVIGQSNLAGDLTYHPFLWQEGVLTDLGTLGGDNGTPIWINNAGDVVGEADIVDNQATHAFLWRKGVMIDLGSLGDNSHATAINSKRQVVGWYHITGRTEPPFRHAFVWEEGGSMVDLNTLIPPSSGLELVAADNINERGEIVGVGVPARCFPDFCGHLFLLIPCAVDDDRDCADGEQDTRVAVQSNAQPVILNSTSIQDRSMGPLSAWRMQMANRYHIHTIGPPHK